MYVDFEAMVKEDRMIRRALTLKKDLAELVSDSIRKRGQPNPDMEGIDE